ncbi:DMT family transporter [Candidatus Absconditicoccus praedator]|uniref:DMT family transporter n=1 Tax=Candidatus Absconditicoccus praedator TaxID=2735562 RepID=UPI001E3AA2F7|nr:DMT family transporter [Candidatus Absconditicoccus praedator]UFX82742.1 DMT family transporter [Candidatus Absconditicoccus praedator]
MLKVYLFSKNFVYLIKKLMGIFWIIPVTFLWAVTNIVIKKLQNHSLSSEYILFVSGFISAIILLISNYFMNGIDFGSILTYSYIGAIGYFSYVLLINSFRYINIGLAVLISNLSIIFANILNYLFLAEFLSFDKQIILIAIFALFGLYAYFHYQDDNKDILKGLFLAFSSSILAGVWYFAVNYNMSVSGISGFELKSYAIVGGLLVLFLYIIFYKGFDYIKQNTNTINLKRSLILVLFLLAFIEVFSDSAFFSMYNYHAGALLNVLALFEIAFSFLLGFLIFKEKNLKIDYVIFSLIFVLLVLFMI